MFGELWERQITTCKEDWRDHSRKKNFVNKSKETCRSMTHLRDDAKFTRNEWMEGLKDNYSRLYFPEIGTIMFPISRAIPYHLLWIYHDAPIIGAEIACLKEFHSRTLTWGLHLHLDLNYLIRLWPFSWTCNKMRSWGCSGRVCIFLYVYELLWLTRVWTVADYISWRWYVNISHPTIRYRYSYYQLMEAMCFPMELE